MREINPESNPGRTHQGSPWNSKWDLVKNTAFALGTVFLIGGGIVAADTFLKAKGGGNDLGLINDQGGPLALLPPNGENSGSLELGAYNSGNPRLKQEAGPLAYWLEKCRGEGLQMREHSRDFRVDDETKMMECFHPLL